MAISTAVDLSAVARVVGIATEFRDLRAGRVTFLPQRIAVFGQGNTASTYAVTKRQVNSALEVGQVYGFGSPLHMAVSQLLPINGDGVGTLPVTVYPFDDEGGSAAAAGTITVSGSASAVGSFRVVVNGIRSEAFAVASGDDADAVAALVNTAVSATLSFPMTSAVSAAVATLTAKWQGTTGNSLSISIEGPTTVGLTFAIVQPVSGATNPDVMDGLNQIGNVWETLILNCFDIADTTALTAYSDFGESRWGALTRRPLMVFTGNTESAVATAIAVSDARRSDRTNCQLVAPGSVELPWVIAARELSRIAVLANNNPPRDYGSQRVSGVLPGLDSQQWTYTERDRAVKAGSSTVEVRDDVVTLSDTVTFYHPEGDTVPAYRYVVDVIKLQNILFNVDLIFNQPSWDGAPLIPDNQPTTNREARKPKDAIAAINSLIDNLGLEAIISDPETAKASTRAGISTQNPKRLDIATTVQLSGNDNITSIDLRWGFFFGTAPIV